MEADEVGSTGLSWLAVQVELNDLYWATCAVQRCVVPAGESPAAPVTVVPAA